MAELGPSGIHRMEMALARQKAVLQADCIGTSGWLLSVVDAVRLPEWIGNVEKASWQQLYFVERLFLGKQGHKYDIF